MNPLIVPGLLLLAWLRRNNGGEAPRPTPPPGGSSKEMLQELTHKTLARRAAPQRRTAPRAPAPAPASHAKAAPPKPPQLTIEHPDVIPASQAPMQAAVDAVVSHAIRETETSTSAATSAPPPTAASGRTPKQAAQSLMAFLIKTGRFGTLKDRPEEVKAAQRDMGLTPDGIVGKRTRAAAQKQGVALPPIK